MRARDEVCRLYVGWVWSDGTFRSQARASPRSMKIPPLEVDAGVEIRLHRPAEAEGDWLFDEPGDTRAAKLGGVANN